MKTRNSIIIASVLLFAVSCKKDDDNLNKPETEEIESFVNFQQGTWWLYQWYKIDSLGNETIINNQDSLYVIGDVEFNGKNYMHVQGTFFTYNDTQDYYFRDSSSYVIDNNGKIRFSHLEISDTIDFSTQTSTEVYSLIKPFEGSYSVPAGTYNNIRKNEVHYYTVNGTNFTECDFYWVQDTYYDPEIGELSSKCAYTSELQWNCSYYERRLIDFNVVH